MNRNLDLFNEFTAKIFASLLESFPVPQQMPHEQFGACNPDDYWNIQDPEQQAAEDTLCEVIMGTFTFLSENEYITYTPRQDAFIEVRLTEKALLSLNQIPESLEGGETTGQRVIDAVKDGTTGAISSAVTGVFNAGINIITSAIS